MPHTESDSGNEQVYGPEIPPRLVPNFFNRHMNIPGNSIYVPVEYGSYGAAFSDVSMYGSNSYSYGYNLSENNFTRLMGETFKGGFQNVEYIVAALNSFATTISSTYSALHNSFRAINGAVNELYKLNSQVESFFVTCSIFRWLKYFWQSLMAFLRLKPADYVNMEAAWLNAVSQTKSIFFRFITFGMLCLIYFTKVLKSHRSWINGFEPYYEAKALYDFEARASDELTFSAGQILRIAPKEKQPAIRGWILGSTNDGKNIGLIPMNYIDIVLKKSPDVCETVFNEAVSQ